MCSPMSNTNFHFVKLEKESSMGEGIVSILRSECEARKPAAKSLRRTLSADMSSKKWLAQNGFSYSPMKRIASSEELVRAQEEDERPGQEEVWRSIQAQNKADGEWSWGSILLDKTESPSKLPPPYTPPLMRASGSSCLSEKSLEICTESLGSETGSDGYSPSEEGDVEEQQQLCEDLLVPVSLKWDRESRRILEPRTFPPPLPSLAREDGASLHMQSHRRNGRLVLQAVSVASHTYFQAYREHGRLRLSLLNNPASDDEGDDSNFEELGESSCVDDADGRFEIEMDDKVWNMGGSGGIMHHMQTPIMVKKVMGIDKKNLAWSSRFNNGLNLLEREDGALSPLPLPHSLPPPRLPPLISNPPSFNAYEYFWREKKPVVAAGIIKPRDEGHQSPPDKNAIHNQRQNLVLTRGNKAELVPSLRRSCNESTRRSLLLWEPHCIAT